MIFLLNFRIIDEWISMNSSRLRPIEKEKAPGPAFSAGDRCLARWTDSRKFPATVHKVLENSMSSVFSTVLDQFCSPS